MRRKAINTRSHTHRDAHAHNLAYAIYAFKHNYSVNAYTD